MSKTMKQVRLYAAVIKKLRQAEAAMAEGGTPVAQASRKIGHGGADLLPLAGGGTGGMRIDGGATAQAVLEDGERQVCKRAGSRSDVWTTRY